MSFLSEFDMEIKHIRWKENKIADALNRNACQNITSRGSSAQIDVEDLVKKAANQDPNYETLLMKLPKKEKIDFTQNQEGLIYYKKQIICSKCGDLEKRDSR